MARQLAMIREERKMKFDKDDTFEKIRALDIQRESLDPYVSTYTEYTRHLHASDDEITIQMKKLHKQYKKIHDDLQEIKNRQLNAKLTYPHFVYHTNDDPVITSPYHPLYSPILKWDGNFESIQNCRVLYTYEESERVYGGNDFYVMQNILKYLPVHEIRKLLTVSKWFAMLIFRLPSEMTNIHVFLFTKSIKGVYTETKVDHSLPSNLLRPHSSYKPIGNDDHISLGVDVPLPDEEEGPIIIEEEEEEEEEVVIPHEEVVIKPKEIPKRRKALIMSIIGSNEKLHDDLIYNNKIGEDSTKRSTIQFNNINNNSPVLHDDKPGILWHTPTPVKPKNGVFTLGTLSTNSLKPIHDKPKEVIPKAGTTDMVKKLVSSITHLRVPPPFTSESSKGFPSQRLSYPHTIKPSSFIPSTLSTRNVINSTNEDNLLTLSKTTTQEPTLDIITLVETSPPPVEKSKESTIQKPAWSLCNFPGYEHLREKEGPLRSEEKEGNVEENVIEKVITMEEESSREEKRGPCSDIVSLPPLISIYKHSIIQNDCIEDAGSSSRQEEFEIDDSDEVDKVDDNVDNSISSSTRHETSDESESLKEEEKKDNSYREVVPNPICCGNVTVIHPKESLEKKWRKCLTCNIDYKRCPYPVKEVLRDCEIYFDAITPAGKMESYCKACKSFKNKQRVLTIQLPKQPKQPKQPKVPKQPKQPRQSKVPKEPKLPKEGKKSKVIKDPQPSKSIIQKKRHTPNKKIEPIVAILDIPSLRESFSSI